MRRRLVGLIGVVVLAAGTVAIPLAPDALAQEARPPEVAAGDQRAFSTPQLIDQAAAGGAISSVERLRLLALALFHPDQLPAAYQGTRRWDGTVPLLELHEAIGALPAGATRTALQALLVPTESRSGRAPTEPSTTQFLAPGEVRANAELPPDGASRNCGGFSTPTSNVYTSDHFYIEYDATDILASGLTAADYATSLEAAWTKELQTFGWVVPPVKASDPAPGNRTHVRIEPLSPGELGFTTSEGKHAGFIGDNPNTAWNEPDALAACIVLNSNFALGGPGGPSAQQVLDATTAHEFNHAIQMGLGSLTGPERPDLSWIEGGATWMEDEVFDNANLGNDYLYPLFTESMGDYDDSDPYPFWFVFRGLTERFGTGSAGGGEQVMQEFWERLSQNGLNGNGALMQNALNAALQSKGTNLPDAFHAYAIAAKFIRGCGNGYSLPYCFQEAAEYRTSVGGIPAVQRTISASDGSASASIEDNYAINWVRLPATGAPYRVSLSNNGASGAGAMRATVVCDTNSGFRMSGLPSVISGGQATTLASFDPAGCADVVAVITNQAQTDANPDQSLSRPYTMTLGPAEVLPSWRGGVVRGNQWYLRDAAETLPGGVANLSFAYGDPGDAPLMCDWNGDGLRTPGIRRGFTFYLRNENSSGGASMPPVPYGNVGDRAVCGDWDGDGDETVGVVRGNEWFLKGTNDPGGGGDQHFFYGDAGDVPIVGDWDGDGDTDIGIRRGIVFYLRSGGGGTADIAPFAYGDPGDIPFSSDPDRDGRFSVGVHRRGQWFLNAPNATSFYGDVNDFPVIWFVPGA
jgi:hypothetical protein